jgi:hypothetical protein
MNKIIVHPAMVFIPLFIFFLTAGKAQEVTFIPCGSYSNLYGDGSAFWKEGFSVGINAFYQRSERLMIGARIAYNRWKPDGYAMMELTPSIRMRAIYTSRVTGIDSLDYENLYLYDSESGSTTIIEIVPSVRWKALKDGNEHLVLALQGGPGLYIINSKASARGQYGPHKTTVHLETISEIKPGVQLGLTLTIRRQLEFQPLFNYIITDSGIDRYYAINLSFVFQTKLF